jgi:hypothetical protein
MQRDSRTQSLALPLDYFKQSPVRGQLEPPDETTKDGWRYIQCTETVDELKVLLPPETARKYKKLLKAELQELSYGPHCSRERVLEIRRLKDRMIRKCRRLVATRIAESPGGFYPNTPVATMPMRPSGGLFPSSRIIAAPEGFRLKELERWLELEEVFAENERKKQETLAATDCLICRGHNHEPSHHRSSRRPHRSRRHARFDYSSQRRTASPQQRMPSPAARMASPQRRMPSPAPRTPTPGPRMPSPQPHMPSPHSPQIYDTRPHYEPHRTPSPRRSQNMPIPAPEPAHIHHTHNTQRRLSIFTMSSSDSEFLNVDYIGGSSSSSDSVLSPNVHVHPPSASGIPPPGIMYSPLRSPNHRDHDRVNPADHAYPSPNITSTSPL